MKTSLTGILSKTALIASHCDGPVLKCVLEPWNSDSTQCFVFRDSSPRFYVLQASCIKTGCVLALVGCYKKPDNS